MDKTGQPPHKKNDAIAFFNKYSYLFNKSVYEIKRAIEAIETVNLSNSKLIKLLEEVYDERK